MGFGSVGAGGTGMSSMHYQVAGLTTMIATGPAWALAEYAVAVALEEGAYASRALGLVGRVGFMFGWGIFVYGTIDDWHQNNAAAVQDFLQHNVGRGSGDFGRWKPTRVLNLAISLRCEAEVMQASGECGPRQWIDAGR